MLFSERPGSKRQRPRLFGLKGKAIGEMLDLLLDQVISDHLPNEKEALLSFAGTYGKKG